MACALQAAEEVEFEEPSTYQEAIRSTESAQWMAAMSEELESLHKNQTWELVKGEKNCWLQVGLQEEGWNPRG